MHKSLIILSLVLLFGILFLPEAALAADYDTQYSTSGRAATNNAVVTYFYVTVDSAEASITLHQNEKGLMHWKYDGGLAYYRETDRYAYATYIVNYKKDDGNSRSWEYPDHSFGLFTEAFRGKDWTDEDFTISFNSPGTYIVRITSGTGSSAADNKYAEEWYTLINEWVSDHWIDAPSWCVSSKRNCKVSTTNNKKGQVVIYHYKDGIFFDSETVSISSSQYISPKTINGCTCSSGDQYVSLDASTGKCSPSSINFYYTSNYNSGVVTIKYFTDGYYYDSETKMISSSQYISPKSINGYSCSSGSQYVSLDTSTGKCSPANIEFYYTKNSTSEKKEYSISISINHYSTDNVWLSGRFEVLCLSPGNYTITPDYERINYNGDVYSLTGTRSYNYTVYSDGSASQTGFSFYYQKQSKNISTSSDNSGGSALYGLAKQKLATRTGPSTKYADGGTFFVQGQYIKVLSRSYDKANEIWWVKCEIPDNGTTRVLWTGYKRFDSSTLPLERIPIE